MSALMEMLLMNWVFKGVDHTPGWTKDTADQKTQQEIEFRLFSLSDENAKWFLSGCIFALFLLIAFVINNYKNNWEIRRANREAALVRQMSVKVWRSRNLSLRSTPGEE